MIEFINIATSAQYSASATKIELRLQILPIF